MSASNKTRETRSRLLTALRKELMGPSDPDEQINEFPTTRYLVGRLAPARVDEHDDDAKLDTAENDTLGVGADSEEDGEEDSTPPLITGFSPSSFGLSFLVDVPSRKLKIKVSWGDYKREKRDGGGYIWKRYPREALIDGLSTTTGKITPITLSATDPKPPGVTVVGTDDPELSLEGVVHEFSQYRAVSLFLVNRRTKGQLGDRSKDERWIYQPILLVTTSDGSSAFVAKDALSATDDSNDGEAVTNALLYRHALEFATGHGVAAGWISDDGENRAKAIFTEFIPDREIPLLIAPAADAGLAVLDMQALAEISDPAKVSAALLPLIERYEAWVSKLETEAKSAADITGNMELRDAASENIRLCACCAARMRQGLDLIEKDANAFEAFRFANRAMADQRIHSLWAAENRTKSAISGSPADFDKPENRTWRPFQMGFILTSLTGIAEEKSDDRELVDLLWFPTGGGKTEAYLGLSAFVMALRRLRGDRHGMHGGAGVSIVMRYTLRLLTVQQFQRATALVAACEVIRRTDPARWGSEIFRAGIWVGRGTTPNTFSESKNALDDLQSGKKPREGSPVQLVSCPRCGTTLANDKGIPENLTYVADNDAKRTLIWCPNSSCEFSAARSNRSGLPVVIVDDEIYRTCPTLIVGTVDKFARLPFKGEARALFGSRDRYSATFGHLTAAHGDKVDGKKIRDAAAAPALLPPELIIQDELHLISGPLGTMVGLYETAVDFAGSFADDEKRVRAKVIASTATIRRAPEQSRQLFARRLCVFPPPGLSSRDSFFAREQPIDPENDATAGRLYIGVNAPGSSTKTLLVRVYSVLLAATAREMDTDASTADPYGTLVGYFNSLRALGGAKRLVEDDIKLTRLKYLAQQQGFPRRSISDPEELTSRLESWKIPGLLKKLDIAFPRSGKTWPVDVLLATNMISVGVDIDRLGLMVVTGQPKTTAEYIQATSRIGRKHPGLVVTMYNWLGARDLSHYERFQSYHTALYRYVEAISVTPFSSRALDRGLHGAFAAMNRLASQNMAQEPNAQNFDPSSAATQSIIEEICNRAIFLVGKDNADLVRDRLLSARDEWAHLGSNLLRYSWLNDSMKPPNNSRVLLKTAGTDNEGKWTVPGSLREVEPTAAFFLEEGED